MSISLNRQSPMLSTLPLVGQQITSGATNLTQGNAIKVFVRFRPAEGAQCVEELGDQHVKLAGYSPRFFYDQVLKPDATQSKVFETCVKSTVEGVLLGYNGCVLAYGQTGAGKSHTMMGSTIVGKDRGMIPRMVEHLFEQKGDDVKVKVGYMEIYNERVRDLLADSGDKSADLKVHEHVNKGGFYAKGLKKVEVSNCSDVYALMFRGNRNRSTATTAMNPQSSRSHSVFMVYVQSPTTRAKLVLVDLAGSEKVAKTGAKGINLEEASNINRSLTSLGMVINALAANQAISGEQSLCHVPFRDSKLTRILQDCLAGNSRTCLIIHCSPAMDQFSETVSSLRFGLRAKTVETQVSVNYIAENTVLTSYDLVQAHAQLHAQLLLENERLTKRNTEDCLRSAAQQRVIKDLEAELRLIQSSSNDEEQWLAKEIQELKTKISQLCE